MRQLPFPLNIGNYFNSQSNFVFIHHNIICERPSSYNIFLQLECNAEDVTQVWDTALYAVFPIQCSEMFSQLNKEIKFLLWISKQKFKTNEWQKHVKIKTSLKIKCFLTYFLFLSLPIIDCYFLIYKLIYDLNKCILKLYNSLFKELVFLFLYSNPNIIHSWHSASIKLIFSFVAPVT